MRNNPHQRSYSFIRNIYFKGGVAGTACNKWPFNQKLFLRNLLKLIFGNLIFRELKFSELLFITNFFTLCNADGFWSSSNQTYFNQLEIIFTL